VKTHKGATEMKIFISGKITGDPDYRERFAQAEREIINKGHMVMNPAILPAGFSHAEYMTITLAMQRVCDATYMMPGWEESEGAKMEGIEAAQIIYDLADIPDEIDCCKREFVAYNEWIAGCDVEFEPIDLSPGMIDFFKFCPICGKRIVRV
jgi:hypothetical protein